MRSRLIEANVSRAANSQKLKIKSANGFDLGFVSDAKRLYFFLRKGTIGDIYLICRYIDMVKQMLVHKVVIALHV